MLIPCDTLEDVDMLVQQQWTEGGTQRKKVWCVGYSKLDPKLQLNKPRPEVQAANERKNTPRLHPILRIQVCPPHLVHAKDARTPSHSFLSPSRYIGKMARPTTFTTNTPGPGSALRATCPMTWQPTLTRKTNQANAWNTNRPRSLLPDDGPTPGVVERYMMKQPSKICANGHLEESGRERVLLRARTWNILYDLHGTSRTATGQSVLPCTLYVLFKISSATALHRAIHTADNCLKSREHPERF